MKYLIPLFFFAMTNPIFAGMYKCQNAAGKIVYQQTSCADSQQEHDFKVYKSSPSEPSSGLRPGEIELYQDIKQREHFDKLIGQEKIAVGMSPRDVERSWGMPIRINQSVGSYGVHEQWVYRRVGAGYQYVYIENDVVSSIGD